ncbi:hypothetical protein OIV83_006200 [Microbotryomycetes sp. JL201]|nr:hypothetical protein OIV83_006200 [Microbotryomycetes sp. JL201]
MGLWTILSAVIVFAIYTGERIKDVQQSVRKGHPLHNWGLRWWIPIVSQVVFTLNASYLYMTLWVVAMGVEGKDFCFANVTAGESECSADGYKLGFFAAGLALMGGLLVLLEITMVRIENEFENVKAGLRSAYGPNGNLGANRRSNSGYGDTLASDNNDGYLSRNKEDDYS